MTEANEHISIDELKVIADKGNASAQCQIGGAYVYGKGVKRDLDEGVKWYRLAAEQHHPHAQYYLGDVYSTWYLDDREDYKEAVNWYQLAAEQGLDAAQMSLAMMYYRGRGVDESEEEAIKWWRKAAKQGNIEAQKVLEEYE